MARTTAMRVRIDMATRMDATDLDSVMKVSKAIQDVKKLAEENGFTLISDVSAKVGSYDFGDETAPDTPDEGE